MNSSISKRSCCRGKGTWPGRAATAAQESRTQAIKAEGPGTPYVKLNLEIMSGQRQ